MAVNVFVSAVALARERKEAILFEDSSEDLSAQSGAGQMHFVCVVEDPKKLKIFSKQPAGSCNYQYCPINHKCAQLS